LSQEEIDRMVSEAEEFAEQDKKVKGRIDARNQLETYCFNMKQVGCVRVCVHACVCCWPAATARLSGWLRLAAGWLRLFRTAPYWRPQASSSALRWSAL
jgi:hypothetical protein